MIRFALDEGFPDTILETLMIGVPEAELLPLRKINKRLLQMDDWELILSLYHLGNIDGLVTTDSNILNFPRTGRHTSDVFYCRDRRKGWT